MIESKQRVRLWQPVMTRRAGIAALVAIIWLVPLITAAVWVNFHRTAHPRAGATATANAIRITNGSSLWENDAQTIAAPTAAGFSPTTTQVAYAVDPAFQAYYAASAGKTTLGAPLTPAFPVLQGWLQIFTSGALLLPKGQGISATASSSGGLPDEVVRSGLVDSATGIVRLPLLHALLTVGSELPVGGSDSPITYAALRSATHARAMVKAPAGAIIVSPAASEQPTAASTAAAAAAAATPASSATANVPGVSNGTSDVFVPGGMQGTTVIGHVVPATIWQYINDPTNAPDGWQTDFGSPLTEALPFSATINGSPHALLVQVFWRGALLVDTTAANAAGQPTIAPLGVGVDYLRALGPPNVVVTSNAQAWALGDAAALDAPGSGKTLAHIGTNFPLTLTGQAQWLSGALWYSVRWQSPKSSGTGWVPAQTITPTAPAASAPAYAGFDVLSPDLEQYLGGLGNKAGAVAYDVTRNTYYTYNPSGQFTMASSAKVPIMLTFLAMTESQGREPNGNEMYLLQTMIENSDNNSAQALFDEFGGVGAMSAFLHSVNIGGFNGYPDGWGWSTITPMAMVQMLTLLHEGKVLTAQDRTLALNLMEHIESDQRNGVGNTAPSGATVAMKDGWVPGPDGLWAVNSSGIVTVGSETYIIAVYSQHQQELDDGWAITEKVCGQVGKLLT